MTSDNPDTPDVSLFGDGYVGMWAHVEQKDCGLKPQTSGKSIQKEKHLENSLEKSLGMLQFRNSQGLAIAVDNIQVYAVIVCSLRSAVTFFEFIMRCWSSNWHVSIRRGARYVTCHFKALHFPGGFSA